MPLKDSIKKYRLKTTNPDDLRGYVTYLTDLLVSQKFAEVEKPLTQEVRDKIELAIEQLVRMVQNHLATVKKGDKGDAGKDGLDGIDGRNGRDGRDGKNGRDGLDGKDGVTPNLEDMVPFVLAKLPKVDDMTADKIARSLETLKGNDRLDKSAIKGLDELVANLTRMINEKTRPDRGGGGGGDSVQYVDLSAQLNGVLKTFTIPAHRKIVSISADSAPFNAFRPTTDFTHTRTSITFTSQIDETVTLATGHSLIITYTR